MADFGASNIILDEGRETVIGTCEYMAPEIIKE